MSQRSEFLLLLLEGATNGQLNVAKLVLQVNIRAPS